MFGRRAGEAAASFSRSREVQLRSRWAVGEAIDDLDSLVHEGSEIVRPAQRALRNAMWECCGVVRSEEDLKRGLTRVAEIHDELGSIGVRPTAEGYGDLAHVLDLRAALVVAQATLHAARERRETRDCHNRSDFPQLDRDLQVNFQLRLVDEALELSSAPVPRIPDALRGRVVDDREELDVTGRLLE